MDGRQVNSDVLLYFEALALGVPFDIAGKRWAIRLGRLMVQLYKDTDVDEPTGGWWACEDPASPRLVDLLSDARTMADEERAVLQQEVAARRPKEA